MGTTLTKETVKMFGVVALAEDLPDADLRAGQTGTIVERLTSGANEVEFTDAFGNTLVSLALEPHQFRKSPI